ncbi:transcriptional regulator [Vibrio vulnificus]|nr:transcriptional regulator [Vibrio vulnificus]
MIRLVLFFKSYGDEIKCCIHINHPALVGKRLIEKLTPPARYLDPLSELEAASPDSVGYLKKMLAQMQHKNETQSFGICRTCRHHEDRPGSTFYCRLTELELEKKFGELICREHQHQS